MFSARNIIIFLEMGGEKAVVWSEKQNSSTLIYQVLVSNRTQRTMDPDRRILLLWQIDEEKNSFSVSQINKFAYHTI